MRNEQLSNSTDAHCKACDVAFIARWRAEHGIFEDLCPKCLKIAMSAARTDRVVYENCYDEWSQEDVERDHEFIQQFAEEATLTASGDMLDDDPYYEFGEGAMGDLNMFDKY